MDSRFKGVIPAAVTPFKNDGSFDFDAARKHLDWLIENGVKAICLLGATSEYQSVSNEEHKEYIKEMAPYIKDRVTVLMGASRERPEDVIDLIENGSKYGVQAAMVIPPFYYHAAQDEIIKHYEFIDANVDMPLMVYNNPGSAGIQIDLDTFDELFKLKNVHVVKESSGDIKVLTDLLGRAPDDVSLLCGTENLLYESFAVGAHGWISLLGNVAPRICVEMYETMVEQKDFVKGMELYRKMLPALTYFESTPKTTQAAKHILNSVIGIQVGTVRRPRYEMSEKEKQHAVEATQIHKLIQ